MNHEIMVALNGQPILWAGTQESFDIVVEAQKKVAALEASGGMEAYVKRMVAAGGTDENGYPLLWEKRGAVAVVSVSGSLVDGSAGFWRLFGACGYDDVAEAAIAAYSDPDVKSVLFKIESPGGQVSGVMDCGQLLNTLSGMKPSAVYTGGLMASGGYWLGSSVQGTISAGPTAEVGSIGVIMVLTDLTEALKMAGIKKTVMRAGDDKARINSFEKPTDKALADLQQNMDDVHSLFRAQVQKGRPSMTTDELLAATTGKTFLGKRAKNAGLVDKVASFEQALKLLDSQITTSNTPTNSKGATMKTVLTSEQIAKISAGVPLTQLGLSAEALKDVQDEQARQTLEAKALADADAEKTAKAALQATTDAEAAAAAAKLAGKTETADGITKITSDLVTANVKIDLLNSQLVIANAGLLAKEVELTNLKATTQTMTANHDGLVAVARIALGKMQIAMGGSDTTEGMDAATVIAQHTAVSEKFNTHFKIGQASKGAADVKPVAEKPSAEMLQFQRAAAAAQANRTTK